MVFVTRHDFGKDTLNATLSPESKGNDWERSWTLMNKSLSLCVACARKLSLCTAQAHRLSRCTAMRSGSAQNFALRLKTVGNQTTWSTMERSFDLYLLCITVLPLNESRNWNIFRGHVIGWITTSVKVAIYTLICRSERIVLRKKEKWRHLVTYCTLGAQGGGGLQ